MSYILEALKKAERERQKEAVPDLQTSHAPYPSTLQNHSYRRRSVKLITILFLLTVTAFTLLMLRDKPLSTDTGRQEHVPRNQPSVVQSNEDAKNKPTEQEKTIEVASPDIHKRQEGRPPAKITLEPKPIVLQGKPVISPVYEQKRQTKYPSLEELGTAFRADMPELIFAGHTFSDTPEERMIIINNRIVREGQNLGNGLRLEEITWDGLVMNYNGTRFTMKATH